MASTLGGMALFFCDQITLTGFSGNVPALARGVSFAGMAILMRKQRTVRRRARSSWGTCAPLAG